ncbi:MAG TPA: hypothetical protein DCZ02_00710 [Ruminococcaceae bacterium]|nr:hypothetical protein [Oscillospiraceae bacterium]
MTELKQAFAEIAKALTDVNNELSFRQMGADDTSMTFSGEKGIYRLVHDSESNILQLEVSYEDNGDKTEYSTISKSLFDLETIDARDIKSTSNELIDELERMFKVRKQVNLDKVKMPKSVSRTKAKNGIVSYDIDSLANRFGTLYPEFKDEIKANVVKYGEFLPEDFFINHGNQKVLDVIQNGTKAEQKKLFKMLGEVFEDGINDVQDVIAVTILGEMKNDKKMMAVADEYMSEYMAGAVHEVNKITAKKNRYTKRLNNPPVYKPKKKKTFSVANQLGQQ